MEKWIGKRPTIGQKALVSKYERLLVQAQNTIISSTEKVLKVIEAECDKKSGRELDGVLILTSDSIIFMSKREHMVYKYSQISDIDVRNDGKDKHEWQITLKIGRSKRIFDDIKKNDDSQEFIETLEHMIVNQSHEIHTTVTHDFDYFLHSERLADLRTRGIKITTFLMKRDDLGQTKNGERLLREKHKYAVLIVEGYYHEKQKKGNFIVIDNGVLLYEYNDKERKAQQIHIWPLVFFSNTVIDHYAIKTVISNNEGKLVMNNSGKKFTDILSTSNIPFKIKTRKWHQKILGFRSGKWWKKTIASLVYLFTLLMIVAIAFGEESKESDNVKPATEVSDSNTDKSNEAARLSEEKRKQEEANRIAEEQRKQEAAARLAEEQRKQEEAARLAEEQRKQEEAARLAEEKLKQEEADRLAQEQKQVFVNYKNCSEARAAGAAPIYKGEPGYAKHLDRDGDGIGCDR
ncbi:excalibur calcium-binding domain-containing protein [Bacillus sp. DTU_2020_1000418_1_SI_GHA_SEK_038]|uniref:excalibur calcium-binding domain-containing protein n=1 Tax=Bacillus sp. DTU_2020_1000418_1_SI_GHA_SEK_038 TaxID=3077585 RepID=UPI0028E1E431|nr:excalibur calcium-binding domain-containing protein [Bacillus sp. DTU_2020_1000418_1_SI_GHA_SEK_038]WNS73690.1 excalibur calcium-binding domain-containing protein [Bacillus sp. DTU_2020_1000418_1_SI_GHA_SEK_038]